MFQIQLEQKAQQILSFFSSLDYSTPIIKIARYEGFQVKETDMSKVEKGISGAINLKEKTIFVNKSDSYNRKRFTIAHELAHYFLDHDIGEGEILYRNKPGSDPQQESEANNFAAILLLPANKIKQSIQEFQIDLKNESQIKELAKLFQVSLKTLKIRLSKLGYIG